MQARARTWPRSMLATATHDHKRGEDVRARLAVISEMPEAWIAASHHPAVGIRSCVVVSAAALASQFSGCT